MDLSAIFTDTARIIPLTWEQYAALPCPYPVDGCEHQGHACNHGVRNVAQCPVCTDGVTPCHPVSPYLIGASVVPHVDYPHTQGALYDCAACEWGPCVCEPGEEYGCVSTRCEAGGVPESSLACTDTMCVMCAEDY